MKVREKFDWLNGICWLFLKQISYNKGNKIGEKMSWQSALEIVGCIGGLATLLALMLGPMFYLGAKIEAFKNQMHEDMKEFREELKDYHGRLCSLEEKNKK
jgi:Tfp pilus assembly protein PilO